MPDTWMPVSDATVLIFIIMSWSTPFMERTRNRTPRTRTITPGTRYMYSMSSRMA